MLHVGQQSAFPKLKFIANRLKIERRIEAGRKMTRPGVRRGSIESILSEDDIRSLLRGAEGHTDEDTDGTSSGDELEDAILTREKQDHVDARAEDQEMNQSITMAEEVDQ